MSNHRHEGWRTLVRVWYDTGRNHYYMRINQEPQTTVVQAPIFVRRRSCLTRALGAGCGCVTIIFLIILVMVWLSWGPKRRTFEKTPVGFPHEIALFAPEKMSNATLVRAEGRSAVGALLKAPFRVALQPLRALFDESRNEGREFGDLVRRAGREFKRTITTPYGDGARDEYVLTWHNLDADVGDLSLYYQTELAGSGFDVTSERESDQFKKLIFKKGEIEGTVLIRNTDLRKPGIDEVEMRVRMPAG